MPTDKQTKLIEEILADRQEAISAALVEEAEAVAAAAATSTLRELERMHRTKWTRSVVEGITKAQVAAYRAQVTRGGTDIIEQVVKDLGNGRPYRRSARLPWRTWRPGRKEIRIIGAEGTPGRSGSDLFGTAHARPPRGGKIRPVRHQGSTATAGGEVRPARDGNRVPRTSAPNSGSLIDADFAVEERGMPVEGAARSS